MYERLVNNLWDETRCVVVLLSLFVIPQHIHSWDIAVAREDAITLFDRDGFGESTPPEIQQFSDIYALAYDPGHERLFFSVNDHNTSIFSFDLSNKNITPIVPSQNHQVQGIAYDIITTTLFWTDGSGRTIWKRSLLEESNSSVVLRLVDETPIGIAVSYCKRLLFWTNNNHLNASIDSSELDGSNHQRLITAELYIPLGITIDEPYGKLYWTDDKPGIYYRIERSNLDGTDRELLIHRTHQEPFGIASFGDAIYWTDTNTVWMLSTDMLFPNHTKAKLEPREFYTNRHFKPSGIVANSNATYECGLVFRVPTPKTEVPQNEETVTDSNYCLNSGDYILNSCRCKKGFTGARCEVSLCYNYCLNGGQCHLDVNGFPECRCFPGYEGSRCDRDVCEGFCLNGGRCYMNGSDPLCSCGQFYSGRRCAIIKNSLCKTLCMEATPDPMCDCETMKSIYKVLDESAALTQMSRCEEQHIIIICLTCFTATTMLVIVFLTRKVCVLRRRPRIKKRIIVSKAVKSQTPLTARPHPSSPTEQCEITIENCCNMNICETPCFEPNLRSSRSSSSSSKKTEDRKNLLKNMEEEPGGGSDEAYS